MMQKHFVVFFSPGMLVAESTERPIDSWDVEQAKEMARHITERHNATPYGFQFITRERKDDELDSKVVKRSGMYYLGGTVQTIDEVRISDPGSILLSNMECNRHNRIITNANSWRWTAPLEDGDVVLEWARP